MKILSDKYIITAIWTILTAYLIHYLVHASSIVFGADLSIILSFAERIYYGGEIAIDYYDPNPPLSFLFYVPIIAIKEFLGTPVYYTHFLYALGLCSISFALCVYFLRKFSWIDANTKHILAMTYAAAIIIAPSTDFGDREHVIILGLMPFILFQICITSRIKVPLFLALITLTFGTLVVLMKPHYGLIPTLLLAHRIWDRKDLSTFKDFDFWSLTIGVVTYGIVLTVFFDKFLTIILPDILEIYIKQRHGAVVFETIGYLLIVILVFKLSYASEVPKDRLKIVMVLCLFTIALLIPFFVQGRGLNNHRIPFITVLSLAASTSIFYAISMTSFKKFALTLSALITIFVMHSYRAIPAAYLTHEEFQAMPLSDIMRKYCETNCNFLFLHSTSDLIHQLTIYHDSNHASRFTSMWFLPALRQEKALREENKSGLMSDEHYQALLNKYDIMITQDQMAFKPDFIINFRTDELNILDFFNIFPSFKASLNDYQLEEAIKFNQQIYYPGFKIDANTTRDTNFDIWVRKKATK